MRNQVIIFSISDDVHADRVEALIGEAGRVIRLNLDDPEGWRLEYNRGDVKIIHRSGIASIETISSVFLRRVPNIDSFRKAVPDTVDRYRDYIADQFFSLFNDCLSILDKETLFVNPLSSNCNLGKAVQHRVAEKVGLATPTTYVGSDGEIAKIFCHELIQAGKEVCTKPVQNVRITIDGLTKSRFTEKLPLDFELQLSSLSFCPLIFQSYSEKSFEVRGTIIGDEILACRIDSQFAAGQTATDWRHYNIPKTPHSQLLLPENICDKIRHLHRELNVHCASFDLICQPDNEFIFLETNPYGQWLWVEDLTGLPISKEISRFLAQGLLL